VEKRKNVVEEIKKIICGDCKALLNECKLCLKMRWVTSLNNLFYHILSSERKRIQTDIMNLNIDKVFEDMVKNKGSSSLLKDILIWVVKGKPKSKVRENEESIKDKKEIRPSS